MKKWFPLMIGLVLLVQAVGCHGEDIPELEIIERGPASESVMAISKPELSIEGVMDKQYGVSFLQGDIIIINWHAEGDVQRHHVSITDEDDREIDAYDTTAETGIVKAAELAEGEAYTVTVTAIPNGGLVKRDGVSATMRFARYIPSEEASEAKEEFWPEAVSESASETLPEAASVPTDETAEEAVAGTNEISDSWEQIIAAITYGTASKRYKVGDTKALDLGELGVIHMQLAGFDLDERAGGGMATTTWIAVELLPEGYVMNESASNQGGWRDSDLREYLNDVVYQAIPQTVRERLACVTKHQYDCFDQLQDTDDRIWIPDRYEVFREDAKYYEMFGDLDINRVKRREGTAAWWWLRISSGIPSGTSDANFYYVTSAGYYDACNSNYSGGVAIGFCL